MDEKIDLNRVGCIVRVYLKNGYVYQGTIEVWSKEAGIFIKTPVGELVEIVDPKDISAVSYILKKDGGLMREEDKRPVIPAPAEDAETDKEKIDDCDDACSPFKDEEPDLNNIVSKIHSVVEYHKMKAASEREMAAAKLRSPTCTAKPVVYDDAISVLQSLKNNIRK